MTTEHIYHLFGYFVDIVDISITLIGDALLITWGIYFSWVDIEDQFSYCKNHLKSLMQLRGSL